MCLSTNNIKIARALDTDYLIVATVTDVLENDIVHPLHANEVAGNRVENKDE